LQEECICSWNQDFSDAATDFMVRRQLCNDCLSGHNDRVHILISATEKWHRGPHAELL
jgi:hypothetical protein